MNTGEMLTDLQIKRLTEAFRHACNLGFADIKDNHSSCGSFHIHPFNTHWDEKTAADVKYHVQLYVNTWIVPYLAEVLDISAASEEMKQMARWHRNQAERLERIAMTSKND